MLEPKPLDEGPRARGDTVFIISKFGATVGREVIMQYPTSALPKVGDYGTNEALMLKIMSHVGVQIPGREAPLMLTSMALIDNHVKSAEDLMRLEWAMMNYNFSFFANGKLSGILDRVMTQAVALIQKTLTDLSPALQAKQDGAVQP